MQFTPRRALFHLLPPENSASIDDVMTRYVTRREMLQVTATFGAGLLVGGWSAAGAQTQAASVNLPAHSEQLIRDYMEEFSVPGMQLTYRRGARVLYAGNFGWANREEHQAVASDSLFRIASCSKAFTSAAIFRLMEMGRLSLKDKVFTADGILRQFSEAGPQRDWIHAITIHHLLTHTGGGWGNHANDPMFAETGKNQDQLIRWTLETHPLEHPPGEHYDYSNFGYGVLGRVIEHVSGQSYAAFVRQAVLRPANLRDMEIGSQTAARNEVRYYGQAGENPYNFPIARMDSHGGWIASASDLAAFLASLFAPTDDAGMMPLLKPESLKQMTTGSGANPAYACGLSVNPAGNAWHAGSLPGSISIMVHTHSKLSWAAVYNTRSPKTDALGKLDNLLWIIARSVPAWGA